MFLCYNIYGDNMKNKKIIYIFIILICFIILLFSLYNIFMLYFNYKKEINVLNTLSNSKDIQSNKNVIIYDNNFINIPFLEIDFTHLKEINNSTVGWIQVEDTNINYPFVQANDNSYYLNHSFYNKYNPAGWVFLDYRNNTNFEDKNSIIYAHSQNNKTMFGSLINVLDSNWLNNKNNHIIRTSTEKQNSIWQIFSIYVIPTTNDYLTTNFNNDFFDFTQKLLNRSIYNFNTSLTENDKMLTLSTCYNKTNKLVLHGKLVKTQFRK